MSEFIKTYNFNSITADENSDWKFNNPDGSVGIGTSARKWNWDANKTPSSGTGPNAPQSSIGYIYTEASSPTKNNDVFVMETVNPIDASDENIWLSLYYSANTIGDSAQLRIYVWNGTKWVKEFDLDVGSDDPEWIPLVFDLSDYNNTDLKIKIEVDMNNSGTIWHKDVGIDSIIIEGKPTIPLNQIDNYIKGLNKNINKPKKTRGKAIYINEGTLTSENIIHELEILNSLILSGTIMPETSHIAIKNNEDVYLLRNPLWQQ